MANRCEAVYKADYDRLQKAMDEYAGNAGEVIDAVLHNEGAQLIMDAIMPLLPMSEKSWKGKAPHAKLSEPFESRPLDLAVEVHTKKAYNYLYFPNDGSNTKRHRGNQQFMERGLQEAAPQITDLCVDKLVSNWR